MKSKLIAICTFEAVPYRYNMTYEEFREAALKVGRFSSFEATESQRRARLFTRLCKDPTIKTTSLGYPWTKVERK